MLFINRENNAQIIVCSPTVLNTNSFVYNFCFNRNYSFIECFMILMDVDSEINERKLFFSELYIIPSKHKSYMNNNESMITPKRYDNTITVPAAQQHVLIDAL